MAILCSSPSTRQADQGERSRREPGFARGCAISRSIRSAERRADRLGGGDRLGEAEQGRGRLLGNDRIERFGGAAERLVEAAEQGLGRSGARAGARGIASRSPIVSMPRRRAAASTALVDPKGGERERRERFGLAAVRAEDSAAAAEAGEGMGGARRSGDGDPGGEAERGRRKRGCGGTSSPRRRTDGRRR